jgi:hypothetical protein
VKLPLATPTKLWIGCEWQFEGQCCRTSSHVRAEAGRTPSCASAADPEKLMTSPTFQVVPAAGVVIVAVGTVLPTVIVTEAVADAPATSVTLRTAM